MYSTFSFGKVYRRKLCFTATGQSEATFQNDVGFASKLQHILSQAFDVTCIQTDVELYS